MNRNKLADNLQALAPYLFRKLFKHPPANFPRHQIELLFFIKHHNKKPMSFYSEKMGIPKSNLTVMSDKLFDEGLIERNFDPSDRRVITLTITQKGEEFLVECLNERKAIIVSRLEALNEEDVKRLNELIEETIEILGKLD